MMSDERLIEGTVRRIERGEDGTYAVVSVRGVLLRVLLDMVPDAKVGDRILLHGKVALAKLEDGDEVRG
ncbi:MAG: HypC/HybG/HupF family hydrogenase formation chaperone [Thermotogae bacterium]|nr:HypC/HybG/HupF family hydrogenase formation chaperone [Thermotogota bacterium]